MSLFVIADTHLSLTTQKPMDVFGSRWNGYTEKLSLAWKGTVKDSDYVVIAGDISWAMTLSEAKKDFAFLNALPGKKILLRGNHDYWWSTPAKINAFLKENSFATISLIQNDATLCGDFVICGTRGWYSDPDAMREAGADFKKIALREELRMRMSLEEAKKKSLENGNKEILVFTHFPIVYGDFISRGMLDTLKEYGVKRTFFGHIHGKYSFPKSVNFEGMDFSLISADFLDFRPKEIR